MSRTINLRRQHDAAVDLVKHLATHLDGPAPDKMQAYRIGLDLAKLTGLLRIHFAIEDRTLYPYMIASTNAAASGTAAAFQDEMGELGATYSAFAERWNSEAIVTNFPAFRAEARDVFAAPGNRIERENTILYPLADAIKADQARASA